MNFPHLFHTQNVIFLIQVYFSRDHLVAKRLVETIKCVLILLYNSNSSVLHRDSLS